MRQRRSRPWTSVPNQWMLLGAANWASETALGLWVMAAGSSEAKAGRLNNGQIRTREMSTIKTAAPTMAPWFLRKRRQTFWLGLRWMGERASLIFHPPIQQAVGEIHQEIQHQQEQRIKQ